MVFEWDETKRKDGIKKHGVDMVFAARIFRDHTVIFQDSRVDYAEHRFSAIGRIGELFYVVIFTRRGENIRLISARKAGRRDRRRYQDRFAG